MIIKKFRSFWEMEKLLVLSNFFFCFNVFRSHLLQKRQKASVGGKGLTHLLQDHHSGDGFYEGIVNNGSHMCLLIIIKVYQVFISFKFTADDFEIINCKVSKIFVVVWLLKRSWNHFGKWITVYQVFISFKFLTGSHWIKKEGQI